MKLLHLIVLGSLVFAAAVFSGCRGYRTGSLMHPDIQSVAVGSVQNLSAQPGGGARLRSALARELSAAGAVQPASREQADGLLHATVSSVSTEAVARTRRREPEAGEDSDDVLQPVLYRTTVSLHARLEVPDSSADPLEFQLVEGEAEFDRSPDMPEAQDAAFEQALRNAARKLISTMTEAW